MVTGALLPRPCSRDGLDDGEGPGHEIVGVGHRCRRRAVLRDRDLLAVAGHVHRHIGGAFGAVGGLGDGAH